MIRLSARHTPRKVRRGRAPIACRRFAWPAGQRAGFSLIEVLVALLVLAIGLFGLMAVQTLAVGAGRSGYLRTQAVVYAHDMIERMRANSDGVASGYYNDITPVGESESKPADCNPCSSSQIRDHDRYAWGTLIRTALPNGEGRVWSEDSKNFRLTVTWDDVTNAGDPGLSAQDRANRMRQTLTINVTL